MSPFTREGRLRDLVARLDRAAEAIGDLTFDDRDEAWITAHEADVKGRALADAVDFLHELNAAEIVARTL
jgi:hypothetical protein